MHSCGAAQGISEMARHYQPFGTYHFIVGHRVHTPAPHPSAPGAGHGRIGDASYAETICAQLDVKTAVRAMYVNTKGGAIADHLTAGYQAAVQVGGLSCAVTGAFA